MLRRDVCQPDLIERFLADGLDDAQRLEFEDHLNECSHCRDQLQQRTADENLWKEAQHYLSDIERPAIEDSCLTAQRESYSRLRLDFLGPTDDPGMLGRLAGYEVSGVIGFGGMGIVLKAFDPALNRYAAIKVLTPHYATSEAARLRFAREAQAAAAVIHDNVIAIHGVSEFNGLPYLVMPYIKGESLQKRLDREGPLIVPEVLRIALQTARGLAAAHQQGLVHRDIKPGNILLPIGVERVIITDFGLARAADDASLTRSGLIAGTPQYMSPEQARGDAVDSRSDLFSLGSMMYAMCSGRPPFEAETPYGVLRKITDTQPLKLSSINSDVPEWLCSLIASLLEKEASRRFPSAEAIADLLEQCLAHVQRPGDIPLPGELRQPRTYPRRVLLVVTSVLCASGICAWGLWNQNDTLRDTLPSKDSQPSSVVTESTISDAGETEASLVEHTTSNLNASALETRNDVSLNSPELAAQDLSWETGEHIERIEQTIREVNDEFHDTE